MSIYTISDKYEIRPQANGLCWELWELRTVNAGKDNEVEKMVFTGKYPSTIDHALWIVLESELRKTEKPIHGLKATVEHVREIADNLRIMEVGGYCHCIDCSDDGVGKCDVCGGLMEIDDNFCPTCGFKHDKGGAK